MWHSKLNKCDSGVVGNARPCQGRDRGFEPRLSLLFDEKGHPERMSFFVERAPSGAQSSSVFVPLRSAQSRCPLDTLRRLSLRFNKKGHPKRMSFFVERAPSGAQSSSVSVPLRSAQSRCLPDTLRRLSLLFNKKGKIKSQQRLDNHLIFMIAYKQILGSSSHQGYDVVLFVITPAGWIYIRG